MLDRFCWRSFDMRGVLPETWQADALAVAAEAVPKTLKPRSVTSREADVDVSIPVLTVSGTTVRARLPWMYELYTGMFRDLAQLGCHEPVSCASKDVYGAAMNVQRGINMRYECHVDSNPIEGLLYITDHPQGAGGSLVVANDPRAKSVEEVDRDCSIVYPVAGNLIFFDARRFAHYVRPLTSPDSVRVVVAMNFYTPSCPESARPADLDRHLFGYQADA